MMDEDSDGPVAYATMHRLLALGLTPASPASRVATRAELDQALAEWADDPDDQAARSAVRVGTALLALLDARGYGELDDAVGRLNVALKADTFVRAADGLSGP